MKTYEERYQEVMRHIEAERSEKGRNNHRKVIVASLSAAAVLALAAGTAAYIHFHPLQKSTTLEQVMKKVVSDQELVTGLDSGAGDEIQREYRWEEMMDVQRYKTITYEGRTYTTMMIAVHEDHQGSLLGETEATGQDVYADKIMTRQVKVGAIRGISEEVGLMVRFSEEDKYPFAYVNLDYCPAALGDMIRDLNMKEEFAVSVCRTESGSDSLTYTGLSTEKVWEMLLYDESLENLPGVIEGTAGLDTGRRVISIAVSIDLLGNHHKSLWLTEKGYLCTNLLESGKCFYIGKDKVDAFIDYVSQNCKAVKTYQLVNDGLTGQNEVLE